MPSPKTPSDHKPKTKKAKVEEPVYGAGWATEELQDLKCPSGALVQIRKINPEELLEAGLLDEFDSFTSLIASQTIPKAQGKPVKKMSTVDVAKLLEDPKKLDDMIKMLDKCMLLVLTQPEVFPVPEADESGRVVREPGKIYLDRVRLEDKAYIMSVAVGEVGDLAEFRSKSEEAVGNLSAVPVPELTAK